MGVASSDQPEHTGNTVACSSAEIVVQAERIAGDVVLGAARREFPPPRQLPAPPPWFTGREAELRLLDGLLDGGARTAGIVGTGGMGKTWLALHWAHRNKDRFPDGQLFIDLRGYGQEERPMAVGTAVRCALDALGVDHRDLPAEEAAQVGRYRTLLAAKQVLVVLDNALDYGQVEALLPGSPTCAVLLTSRNRLDGLEQAGALRVPLGALSEVEAHEFLAEQFGRSRVTTDRAATEVLLKCCAGMPLALGVLAGQHALQPQFPLARLAAGVADEATRIEALDNGRPSASVSAVLSWSDRALPRAAREAFYLVGVVGTAGVVDLAVTTAASVFGTGVPEARASLRGLARASLLHEHAPDRWEMHDLVRLHAARLTGFPQERRRAALRALVDHCLKTALAADRVLDPDRAVHPDVPAPGALPEGITAEEWFTSEHACVLAAQRVAVQQGWHAEVWLLAWSLHTFHWQHGHDRHQLVTWGAALASAEALRSTPRLALAHRLLGAATVRAGRHIEGVWHLRRALDLVERLDDTSAEAHAHRALARSLGTAGQHEAGLAHARRALELYGRLGEPRHEADALDLMCGLDAALGRFPEAEAHGLDALGLYRELGDVRGEASALETLGHLARRAGDASSARERYTRALALWRTPRPHVVDTLEGLGFARAELGDRTGAAIAWRAALELHEVSGRTDKADLLRVLLESEENP
ncbi:tetratricopeptide repeat protein [Actinosynnema pretiosum subsp. pretiosum]|uniref:Tetratricopeptide repeat protein n=1 Tax=Actinosynnema pretiosum subsp. pretiosum TaxID=103721 RepID=A0AA45R585_9PSEU|nr:transcriptional regulator, SARP family [Actinosynnema pretiosum subsp. pretiosum]QUF05569.1 tetratricopeptide repeat protein [Actinosynnema pretiosum subsp. pretiosum]